MYKVSLSIIVLSSLFLFSCKQKQPPPPTVVAVNLMTVTAKPVVYYDRYPATTEALSQVSLLAQVQGNVTGIFFKEGSHVTKGQKLYEIDRRIYEANYNSAQDNLNVALGTLKQSQQDADRYTYLNEQRAVAKQLYDHAVITLQNSKNQVKGAQEGLQNAKLNLSYAVITAPFDGTIGFSQVKLGNLVTVGQTVLNTISTDNPMAADILINEKQLPYFEDLQSGKYNSIDSLFTLLLPNNTAYNYIGQISVIDRAVDPQTGSVRVRLVFQNPTYALRAGMSCVIKVRNQDNTPQLVIPYKAVVEQMGEYFVYTVKDTSMNTSDTTAHADKKGQMKPGTFAFEKKVHLGEVVGPDVIIKDGLSEGEKIVVDGVQGLHDGSQVTTSNKQAAENAAKSGAGGGRGGK